MKVQTNGRAGHACDTTRAVIECSGLADPLRHGASESHIFPIVSSHFRLFPIVSPHFRLYEVVSLHMCVLSYKYRKLLEMLPKLMKLCEIMGTRHMVAISNREAIHVSFSNNAIASINASHLQQLGKACDPWLMACCVTR